MIFALSLNYLQLELVKLIFHDNIQKNVRISLCNDSCLCIACGEFFPTTKSHFLYIMYVYFMFSP